MTTTAQPPDVETDGPIAYGARCAWWDSKSAAGSKPSGLPCCPHCGGVLFELESEVGWWNSAVTFEESGHWPRYVEFLSWLRGRCPEAARGGQGLREAFVVFEQEVPAT